MFNMDINNEPLIYFAGLNVKEVLHKLGSTKDGLSHKEATRRLRNFGRNILATEKRANLALEYLAGLKNPLVLILLFASIVAFILGEAVDASIIAIIILLSATLNFFQEYRANQAAEKLKEKVATQTTVIREGKKHEVKITDICLGDVIFLSSGDLVPADARILSAEDFFINQSSLTGESFPVEKISNPIGPENVSLTNLSNIIFFGSSVITGSATAIIVKTGSSTEFGKIAKDLAATPADSEFTRGIKSFSYFLLRTTIFLVLVVFLINAITKHDVFESLLFALAVAVGLTPELLPMILTVTMAKGSIGMAKNGVIVKKLNAIPSLGSMDILCTDKTGTLTEGKIELIKYTDPFGHYSGKALTYAYLSSLFQTGIKNPMDEAVLNYKKVENHNFEKIDEIPFDFFRRKMSIVVEEKTRRYIITKGAPEEVFKSCAGYELDNKFEELNSQSQEKITNQYYSFSSQGYRVLAVAIKEIKSKRQYSKLDESELELIGFIAFFDPPKKGLKDILREIKEIGVEVKVITGDNELVTQKICNEIGLEVKGVLLGQQMGALTDDALPIIAERTTIFARFSPDEKNRIILALKANNHVIGYLGDGVNDAPSLKTADVGISVNNAVDVAKDSAEIILTHKSLEVLKGGILEGRKTFANTLKYIMMGASSNFGNMFSVLGASLFLPFLPMLPIQILLNNLTYDLSQITLPTDNVDKDYIQSPKRWNIKFIRNFMLVFGSISSVFDFLTYFILYEVFKSQAHIFQTGWFMESLATQTLVIHVIRTRKVPFLQSRASGFLFLTTILAVGVGWIIPQTGIGGFFSFAKIPPHIIGILAIIVVVYLVAVEISKRLFYKKFIS